MKISFGIMFTFVFLMVGNAEPIIIHKTEGGGIILSRTYQVDTKTRVNEVIQSASIKVIPGTVTCSIVMSNAYVYRTQFSNSGTSKVEKTDQARFFVGVLELPVGCATQVLFEGEIVDLARFKISESTNPKVNTFQGEALEKEIKRIGLKPPPDADMEVSKPTDSKPRKE